MPDYKVLLAECSGLSVLKLVGEVRLNCVSTIDGAVEKIVSRPEFESLVVDVTDATLIDSTTLGILVKLALQAKKKCRFMPSMISTNPDITRILNIMGFEHVYRIVDELNLPEEPMSEVETQDVNEDDVLRHVIEAHKILMDMNQNNYEQFKDLVASLEPHAADVSHG